MSTSPKRLRNWAKQFDTAKPENQDGQVPLKSLEAALGKIWVRRPLDILLSREEDGRCRKVTIIWRGTMREHWGIEILPMGGEVWTGGRYAPWGQDVYLFFDPSG